MNGLRLISQVLVFVITFTINVRVRAEENTTIAQLNKSITEINKVITQLPNAQSVLQEPDQCLKQSRSCALQTKEDEQFKLVLENAVVHLDRGTSVVRKSQNELRLIAGTVWVESTQEFTVQTDFGYAKTLDSGGQIWASRESGGSRDHDRVVFTAINHEVRLFPRGSKGVITIDPGMESYLGKVGDNGEADYGQPLAVSFHEHLEKWARLYPQSAKQFEADVRLFYGVWKQACERTASIHRTLYERKIASMEEDRAAHENERRKAEDHDRALRDEFRRRFFNDE